jgi:hypothetical protein
MLKNEYGFSANRITVTQVVANLGAMLGGKVVGYSSQIFGRRFCMGGGRRSALFLVPLSVCSEFSGSVACPPRHGAYPEKGEIRVNENHHHLAIKKYSNSACKLPRSLPRFDLDPHSAIIISEVGDFKTTISWTELHPQLHLTVLRTYLDKDHIQHVQS